MGFALIYYTRLSGSQVSPQARSRAFPRSGNRPAVYGGLERCTTAQEAGSPAFSLFGFSHRRFRRLKPNSEKPRERGSENITMPLATRPQGRAYYRCAESPVNGARITLRFVGTSDSILLPKTAPG
jgi:hypothetical protein